MDKASVEAGAIPGRCNVLAWIRSEMNDRSAGFTLLEMVVVLGILGILMGLAVPRYLAVRKDAYKAEADRVLQDAKTQEWAYYQQFNQFDTTGASIGFVAPGGMHWAVPAFSGSNNASVQIRMNGCSTCSPVGTADGVSIILYSDGSAREGSTF